MIGNKTEISHQHGSTTENDRKQNRNITSARILSDVPMENQMLIGQQLPSTNQCTALRLKNFTTSPV